MLGLVLIKMNELNILLTKYEFLKAWNYRKKLKTSLKRELAGIYNTDKIHF